MIKIRNAAANDLPAILDIYNHIIQHTTAVFHYDLQTIEARQAWFAQKQKDNFPVFVAEENNVVVGFSTFGQFRAWQAYQFTVENSVYIKAGERGKGIGKLLMQPLIKEAEKMKIHTIIAGITGGNATSIALHKQFGFVEVACLKEVGYKFNTWLDLIFMQLML